MIARPTIQAKLSPPAIRGVIYKARAMSERTKWKETESETLASKVGGRIKLELSDLEEEGANSAENV